MKNKKNKILISILIIFLCISLCDCERMLTFYEDYHLLPQQIITYSNNTLVFRLVEKLNSTCNVPNLTYRILYLNGGAHNLITIYDN